MPTRHVVAQGESLSSIAQRYGFPDARAIYDHGANSELRKKRPDPNVLYPGDEIVIPDVRAKSVAVATGKAHRIVITRPKVNLRVRLQDEDGRAMANRPYKLTWSPDGAMDGKTDSDGVVQAELPAGTASVVLRMGAMVQRLEVAQLNPMHDAPDGGVSGVHARLTNLGYAPGEGGAHVTPQMTEAVKQFQRDSGLEPTGARLAGPAIWRTWTSSSGARGRAPVRGLAAGISLTS